jgi:hypothetical protein
MTQHIRKEQVKRKKKTNFNDLVNFYVARDRRRNSVTLFNWAKAKELKKNNKN